MTTTTTDDRPAITLRADGRRAQLVVLWLLIAVSGAAFAAAVPGLLWLGELAHLGALAFVVPAVVDGGQLVAAAATAVRRSTGRPAHWEAATLVGLVALSASAQVLHVVSLAPSGQPIAQTAMASVLAAALPLTVLAASHSATRAVLQPVRPSARTRAARPTKPTTRATATTTPADAPVVEPATATPVVRAVPRPAAEATMSVEGAVAAFVAGELSQRAAATAAGISRHRLVQLAGESAA